MRTFEGTPTSGGQTGENFDLACTSEKCVFGVCRYLNPIKGCPKIAEAPPATNPQ